MKRISFFINESFRVMVLVVIIGVVLMTVGPNLTSNFVFRHSAVKSLTFARPEYSRFCGGLALDGQGAYYGVTSSANSSRGHIFRISPDGTTRRVLHTFPPSSFENDTPEAELSLGTDGSLYGVTTGRRGATIFQINHAGVFRTLFRFSPDAREGAGLISLSADLHCNPGQLYGTCSSGGPLGHGTVFSMHSDGTGFQIIHSFGGTPGAPELPRARVIQATDGVLYGTTMTGGGGHMGTVFKLRNDGTSFTVLHHFGLGDAPGAHPDTQLALDGRGKLYGVAQPSGHERYVYLFQIGCDGDDYRVLRTFDPETDGLPFGGLFLASDRNLYGLVSGGGEHESGNLFRIRRGGEVEVIHDFQQAADVLPAGGTFLSEARGQLCGIMPSGLESGQANLFTLALGKPAQELAARNYRHR
jgi:uncharacterized repeat protein (TIGR03803 family)